MKLTATILASTIALSVHSVQAREYISIAGSSTVLPFATIVAERMGRTPIHKTPVVEAGGSSVGKKSVCDGIGTQFIDIANASSRMKASELEYCTNNGITITEIKVGYDGIVLANSKDSPQMSISTHDLGKALVAKLPVNGELIDNPYTKWSDVNPDLPDVEIRVMGPPTTSGTRASFAEIVLENGFCKTDAEAKATLKALDLSAKTCQAIRTDGAFIEAGEQDNLIVQKLQEDPASFGVFGFSYLDQNSDVLQGTILDDVEPTFDNIALGYYTASRAMFFYIKHEHLQMIPGINAYLKEWEKHWEPDGILSDAGMIPMGDDELDEMSTRMVEMPVLTTEDLK